MRRKSILVFGLLLALLAASLHGERPPKTEQPGAFAEGDYALIAGQTAGKLLIINGDAVIAGRVEGWLAVVGGSLRLEKEAQVTGPIMVFGGEVSLAPGFQLTGPGWLAFPPGSRLIALLAIASAIGAALVVAGMIIVGWAVWRLARRFGLLEWLRRFTEYNRRRWPAMFALAGLAVSAFLLAIFVHLAEETVYQQEAALADNVIIWLVHRLSAPWLDRTMLAVTYVGSGYAYVMLAPLTLGLLLRRGLRREGASLAVCLGGAAFLNWALKHFFVRARPELFRVVSETGYSFPSGHAMVSLCFYGILAYIVGRQLSSGRRLLLYFCTGGMVALIGFSRIYLGVHYPSDVAAGYLAGGTWLVFCISLLWWREGKN